MTFNVCTICGSATDSGGNCMEPWRHGATCAPPINAAFTWWGTTPGVGIDTGSVHRAPLEREIAELRAALAREADCGDPDDTLACDCRRHLVRAHHREKEARERAEAALREIRYLLVEKFWIAGTPGTMSHAIIELARAALAGSSGGATP